MKQFLLLLLTGFSLLSCSSDDSFGDKAPYIQTKRLKRLPSPSFYHNYSFTYENDLLKIINQWGWENHDENTNLTHTLSYDKKDELVSIITRSDGKDITDEYKLISKDADKIVLHYFNYYRNNDPELEVITFHLNKKGLIEKQTINWDPNEGDEIDYINQYEYDSNNNIIKEVVISYEKGVSTHITYLSYDNKKSFINTVGAPQWFWLLNTLEDDFCYNAGRNNPISWRENDHDARQTDYLYDNEDYPISQITNNDVSQIEYESIN